MGLRATKEFMSEFYTEIVILSFEYFYCILLKTSLSKFFINEIGVNGISESFLFKKFKLSFILPLSWILCYLFL